MAYRFWLASVLLGLPASIGAQAVPNDLNDFGLVCFCSSRVATPHYPLGLDNNGKLLFAARNGITRDQLTGAGIPFSESQLRMLKDWGVLRENQKLLTTAFPVLEPAAMEALRASLRPAAQRLLPSLQPHAAAIKAEAASRGHSDSAYALLFSYVLDGLVWDALKSSGKLPDQTITVEKPYWAGTFWAVYPKQDSSPGTNTRSTGGAALKMLWNPAVLEPVNEFYGAAETGAWIEALNAGAKLPALFEQSEAQPILVREASNDPLFVHGTAIASPIAHAMLATDLSRELPAADESQRLLIGTHEMIWIVLAELAREQQIAPPKVLTTGARSPTDLAPLLVGVLSPPDKP